MPAETTAAPASSEHTNQVAERVDQVFYDPEKYAEWLSHVERQVADAPPRFEAARPERWDLNEPDQLFELDSDQEADELTERPEQARVELTRAQEIDMAFHPFNDQQLHTRFREITEAIGWMHPTAR